MFNYTANLSEIKRLPLPERSYPANLMNAEGRIEGDVAFASVGSLFFKQKNGDLPQNGQKFHSVEIQLEHRQVNLEHCLFLSRSKSSEFDGQIIFTENIYNFYDLFSGEKVVNLSTYFSCLPVFLLQKKKISTRFKDYTANLNYDLNAYKSFFDKVDSDYSQEDPEVYKNMNNIIMKKEGKKFFSFLDKKLDELNHITKDYSPIQHQIHGHYFRRQLWGFISLSEILYRSNIKPRGYPGDSATLNLIYDNQYSGESVFCRLMHKHPLESVAAIAVRKRKSFISEQLKKSSSSKETRAFRILSVACGPVRELENIISTPDDMSRYHFTFLDQDQDAISDAKNTIKIIEEKFQHKLNCDFLKKSVRTLMRINNPEEAIGKFDFIYSMGLFDYLTDRIAKKLTELLYQMLKPGGRLIIGNFHIDNPSRTYMEYWLDWVLYYRNKTEFLALTEDLKHSYCHIELDVTKSQMFAIIDKEQ